MSAIALKKISQARTAMLLDAPFFGVLALRLRVLIDETCEKAYTNGRDIAFNPAFIETLTHAELIALVAHEVMHCACGHPWRMGARDAERWNVACDYAINPILRDAGFTLPAGALLNDAYVGKSAEWIYNRLPSGGQGQQQQQQGKGQQQQQQGKGQQQGAGTPDKNNFPADDVRSVPADDPNATQEKMQQAVQQAANTAKARGKLPGGMARFAKDAARAKVDWRSVLMRFMQETAKADYSWKMPAARYISRGLYMPSLRSQAMGPIAIFIDTSGSIDAVLLAQFAAQINNIADELQPERITCIYIDARVQHVDTFERGDVVKLSAHGGGGTDFRPAFEWLAKADEPYVCGVYLTDLDGTFPSAAPDVPFLWAATRDKPVPFGEKVLLED